MVAAVCAVVVAIVRCCGVLAVNSHCREHPLHSRVTVAVPLWTIAAVVDSTPPWITMDAVVMLFYTIANSPSLSPSITPPRLYAPPYGGVAGLGKLGHLQSHHPTSSPLSLSTFISPSFTAEIAPLLSPRISPALPWYMCVRRWGKWWGELGF